MAGSQDAIPRLREAPQVTAAWPFGSLPLAGFDVLYLDPPWRFQSNSKANPGRNAMRHYDTMTLKDLAALPIGDLAKPQAAMFLWITTPFFVKGAHLPLLKAWRFKASSFGFVWIKLRPKAAGLWLDRRDVSFGPGLTTRKATEVCLLAVRGRSLKVRNDVHEVVLSPRREHSRKPEEVRERIEQYVGPGRRMLELFARSTRPNWSAWGNETGKFDG